MRCHPRVFNENLFSRNIGKLRISEILEIVLLKLAKIDNKLIISYLSREIRENKFSRNIRKIINSRNS